MQSKIRFAYAPVKNFPNRTRLRICLLETLVEMGFKLISLQYVFVSDEELLNMNREYLAHDYYTDIITFDLSENAGEAEGEIYISKDRVTENALLENRPTEEEYCRVIAHGLLHLCGLKDKSDSEKLNMRKAEELFIGKFFNRKT